MCWQMVSEYEIMFRGPPSLTLAPQVDCLWHFPRFQRQSCCQRYRRHCMETTARFCFHSCCASLDWCLLLPRKPSLVHQKEALLQSLCLAQATSKYRTASSPRSLLHLCTGGNGVCICKADQLRHPLRRTVHHSSRTTCDLGIFHRHDCATNGTVQDLFVILPKPLLTFISSVASTSLLSTPQRSSHKPAHLSPHHFSHLGASAWSISSLPGRPSGPLIRMDAAHCCCLRSRRWRGPCSRRVSVSGFRRRARHIWA